MRELSEEVENHGYPFAYGYLAGVVESYLSGECSKESLRKEFEKIQSAVVKATR